MTLTVKFFAADDLPASDVVVQFLAVPPPQPAPSVLQRTTGEWAEAAQRDTSLLTIWGEAGSLDELYAPRWDAALPRDMQTLLAMVETLTRDQTRAAMWTEAATALGAGTSIDWIMLPAKDRVHAIAWAWAAELLNADAGIAWESPPAKDQAHALAWDATSPVDEAAALTWAAAGTADRQRVLVWGIGKPVLAPVIPAWPSDPVLPPDWPELLPDKAAYMINNSISVVRLPDLTPVACLAADLSIDSSSWAWTVNLTLGSAAAFALLDPTPAGPRQVKVTINGFSVVALVESYQRSRQFPGAKWTVTGRSLSAQLAAPYAPVRTWTNDSLASAAQLALAEVNAYGWDVDWQVPDWTIAAGQLSYQSRAPIDVVVMLAAAVGAVVQSDPVNQVLHVVSRYPTSPSAWPSATPAAVIPPGIQTQLSASYQAAPTYDYVYITGGTQGVAVEATRSGTGGTNPMPDSITDALITAIEAGQERARVELDATGDIITTTSALPIIAPIGVRLPGDLVQVQEDSTYIALVTGVRITADRTQDALRVAMALTLERRP